MGSKLHCSLILALTFIISFFSSHSEARNSAADQDPCNPVDLRSLADFKAGIKVDTSGRLSKWSGYGCCSWEGVRCSNVTGRVTEIRLPGLITTEDSIFQSEMKGFLSPSIISLSSLQVLDLGGLISIGGIIPESIGFRLPDLEKIYLFGNRLTGSLPDSIGNLSKLQELHLHENSLSGSLPSSIGDLESLNQLLLYSNEFTGLVPDSVTKLRNLVDLDLHGNSLSGKIPDKIGELQGLKQLDLSNNRLTGEIPVSITNLRSISMLYLDSNYLQGEIPFPSSCGGQMSSLGFLRLSNNNLTGRLPPKFGCLVSLQRAALDNNKLHGPIPSSLGNLSALSELYLGINQFSGILPCSLGQLSRLIMLNISHNKIKGQLPKKCMSSLHNLQTLNLSFNRLNLISLPRWIAQMPSLSRIFLAGCGIQGGVPEFLDSTPSPIQELDLSANNLTGILPGWLGKLTSLYSLNLSRNSIVSKIPDTVINLQSLGVLDLHSNRLTGSVDKVLEIGSSFLEDGTLKHIDLSDNQFTGGIESLGLGSQAAVNHLNLSRNYLEGGLPSSVGRLMSMQVLDLSYNNLSCELPESLGNVSSLEKLKLQRNKFTGKIPGGFLNLKRLDQLDVSDNLLVGEIPDGKPLNQFPRSSYSGNAGLCGKPLDPCTNS